MYVHSRCILYRLLVYNSNRYAKLHIQNHILKLSQPHSIVKWLQMRGLKAANVHTVGNNNNDFKLPKVLINLVVRNYK